jgi:hypothetical protein
MHDLLPFASRPRPSTRPTHDLRALVNELVNDIQIIGSFERTTIIEVLAGYAHEQRVRVLKEEQERIRLLDEARRLLAEALPIAIQS